MNPFENWFQGLAQRQQGVPEQPAMVNPAVRDTIQQQQAEQQAQMQMANQQQRSPIDSGSMSAINAMRESMSARPKQDIGFLGRLLNTAGNTLSNYSIAGLRSSPSHQARLMGEMMLTPREREEKERLEQQNQFDNNYSLVDYLAKQKKHQDEMAFEREKLAETKRHNNMLGDYYKRLGGRGGVGEHGLSSVGKLSTGEIVDLSGYAPMTSKSESNRYSKAKTLYGGVLHSIRRASEHVDSLEEMTKNNWTKPTDPVMGGVSKFFTDRGASAGLEDSVKIRNKTKVLNDSLTSIRTAIENAKKGGVPGEQMMSRWEKEGILPHLRDSIPTIKAKMEEIDKELSVYREAADLSLKYRRHIDAIDVEEMRKGRGLADDVGEGSGNPSGNNQGSIERLRSEHPELKDYTDDEIRAAFGG